jgi:DNA topoisomerase-1
VYTKEIINEKNKADAPIATFQEMPVQKGVGRFGPFLKWNGIYINVSKKYNCMPLGNDAVSRVDNFHPAGSESNVLAGGVGLTG